MNQDLSLSVSGQRYDSMVEVCQNGVEMTGSVVNGK